MRYSPCDTDKILSSLTALGVTLLGAGSAHAGEILLTQDVTELNGVLSTPSSSYTLALPGTDTFIIQAMNATNLNKDPRWISIKSVGYGRVKTVSNVTAKWSSLILGAPGQNWSQMAGTVSMNGIMAANTSKHSNKAFPAGHYTNAYFAFIFKDTTHGNQLEYGWLEASLTHEAWNNLDVQILAYAWEPDGAELPMGQLPSDVPEPASGSLGALGSLAIGAMMLGASGVKRWKAARNNQKTAG